MFFVAGGSIEVAVFGEIDEDESAAVEAEMAESLSMTIRSGGRLFRPWGYVYSTLGKCRKYETPFRKIIAKSCHSRKMLLPPPLKPQLPIIGTEQKI